MVTNIYLIRHCQSTGNIEHRFQGRFDAPITEAGEQQLALLSLRFRNEPIDIIYTSPLTRAVKTAEAVAKYHPQLSVICDDGLTELDCGKMENLMLSEIAEKFPTTARHWDESPDLCEFPDGETMAEVYTRVNAALDRIVSENCGKTIVIATHGGVLRNLYARVAYGNLEGIRNSQVFGNTSVSLLTDNDGKLSFTYTGDDSHLPDNLRRAPTKYRFTAEQEEQLV